MTATTTVPDALANAEHYVYSAWDANGQALYVGCTNNLNRRMKEHAGVYPSWLDRAVVMTAIPFPTRVEALDAEARQIDKLRPLYNTRHNPRFMSVADADGELLYIGSSIKLWQRIRAHRSGTRWFSEVARVVGEPHPTEAACRLAEALAIRNECPAYNVDNNTLEVEA